MMLSLNGKSRWMTAVILFFGILLKPSICTSETCKQKNVLLVNATKLQTEQFPTKAVYHSIGGPKLCFNFNMTNEQAGCCSTSDFTCGSLMDLQSNKYSLTLDSETLSRQDIVLMKQPDQEYKCMPSKFYNNNSGFLLHLHNCLEKGVKNVRVSHDKVCDCCSPADCKEEKFNLTICPNKHGHCEWLCNSRGNTSSSATSSCSSATTSSSSLSSSSSSSATTSSSFSSSSSSATTSSSSPLSSSSSSSATTSSSSPLSSSSSSATTSSSSLSSSSSATTSSSFSSSSSSATTSSSSPLSSSSSSSATTSSSSPLSSSSSSSSSSSPISIAIPFPVNNGSSLENAANIMNNIAALLEKLGDSTSANIFLEDIKGVITKLAKKEQGSISVGVSTRNDVKILPKNYSETGYSRLVRIPKEASEMAVKRNGSLAAVVVFPEVRQDDPSSTFLNNEMIGIDMGTVISNLSKTIDIEYSVVDKNGSIASCMSWDGKGKQVNWITDGCEKKEENDRITCQCSHLTFFAILMSPVPQNISSSDFTALTYITSIGCGMSLFFLGVALVIHCLIRKGKASDATKILINLFVAMFTLNLSFLINETIGNMGNFGACVAIAATMHYTMLATFTWFFMEAMHLYFNLWKLPTEIKHYLTKIYVAGWGTPAVVVIGLLASQNYDYVVIHTDNGSSSKMCWIPDVAVHQGVNIGYYAIVFLFTFTVFIATVRQVIILKPKEEKAQNVSSTRTNAFSIIGLVLLLGITWAFAFFSYGPMLIPSYYIFTILNSFQGFFLFIYYYNSSKMVTGDRNTVASSSSSSSTVTSNTVMTSPYQ